MTEKPNFGVYVETHESLGSVEIGIRSEQQTLPTRFVWGEELLNGAKIAVATVKAKRLAKRLNKAKPIDSR